jgi:ribosome-binding factor A
LAAAFGCAASAGGEVAKEQRVRMVVKQIQRELDDMLTRDPVMQRAVLPEDSLFADRYLSSLSAIAEVELSNNFQVTPACSFFCC